MRSGIGYGDLLVSREHGEFFGSELNMASKLGEDTAEARELMRVFCGVEGS